MLRQYLPVDSAADIGTKLLVEDVLQGSGEGPFRHCILQQYYNDVEMIVILSNLIDNAIEAEELLPRDMRFITVEMIPRPNAISILVKNRILTSVLARNPQLHTTKDCHLTHGIGLKSVKRLVEKKNGMIEINEENQMFFVHIYYPFLPQG